MPLPNRRLSSKVLENLKLILALAPDAHLAAAIGKAAEINMMMSTIRNALRNPETPADVIESVVSDEVVNHFIDLVGADFAELELRPAGKPTLLSEAIEIPAPEMARPLSIN